jgi:diguanylate cyclase (GGDEF)-like protein
VTSVATLVILLFLAVGAGSASANVPAPAQIVVTSTHRSGAVSVYRLHVTAPGLRASLMLPYDAIHATLEVNGVPRATVGSDFPVGTAPFGHGAAMLPLANLLPADRVVVRVWGLHAKLRFLYMPDVLDGAHAVGFWSGVYYAVLGIVAFFIIVAICVVRDPTMAWYLAFTLSLIAVELARDDAFPGDQATNLAWLLAAVALSTLAVLGFFVSYLRLRTEAPRLLYVLSFSVVAPVVLTAIYVVTTRRPIDSGTIVVPLTIGLIACIAIAAVRRANGYRPATYFAIGFLGLTSVFLLKIGRDLIGVSAPFVERWDFEMGSMFDVLAFAVAVTIRSRYTEREGARIHGDLVTASYEAGHDDLTGLLNRRGLDERFSQLGPGASTVLFVDLDGFKTINDRGGHAAGDDALKIMARILRHAVREDDVVARVGGDEFVVVLTNFCVPAGIADIIERISHAVAAVHPLGEDDPTRFGVSIGHAETEFGKPFSVAVAGADADAYRVKIEHYATSRELRRRDSAPH